MKKILNYFIKAGWKGKDLKQVYSKIREDFKLVKLPYVVDKELCDLIVKKSVEEVINQRNCGSGFVPGYCGEKIKIFGESNLLNDKSIWLEIDNGKNLSKDLLFSKSELFLVINNVFEVLGMKNKAAEILFLVGNNEAINTIEDLNKLIYELFKKDNLV
jgi:hypothetical protein